MSEATKFLVEPAYTQVLEGPKEVHEIIKSECSARDPQSFFHGGDPFFTVVRTVNRNISFPTGLLPVVASRLDAGKLEYELDARIPYLEFPALQVPPGVELRDYQEAAVEAALLEGRGILGLATNAGKSYIAATLTHSYKVPTVVLVVRAEGVNQMAGLFGELFGEENVATDTNQGRPYVILTYKKASNRDLSAYQLVVADEVHRVGAETFCNAVMGAENAYHRFGLSGTPGGREDGKDLFFYGATGPIIYEMPQTELMERGFSASANGVMVRIDGDLHVPIESDIEELVIAQQTRGLSRGEQFKLRKLRAQLWRDVEAAGILEHGERNLAIVKAAMEAHGQGKQVLIMVKRIDHGRELRSMFEDRGVEVPFAHGGSKNRDAIYKGLKSGKHRVVIGSGIYDDTVDVPNIEVLINAAGGKSLIATKQKLGRGLRNPGDKELTVVDFFDAHHRILRKHSNARRRAYKQEGVGVREVEELPTAA